MMDQVPGSGGNEPDKANMEDIMNQYQGVLLRYATRVLNNEEAAQDVVQEAFIRLHGNWDKVLRRGVPIKGWLFRTTHNAAVDYIRKESRRRLLHEKQSKETDPYTADCDDRREHEERHALVLQHLNILRPKEREVLVLRICRRKCPTEKSRRC
jgi:RNA polymerase sigma factor (sigma-70 family)